MNTNIIPLIIPLDEDDIKQLNNDADIKIFSESIDCSIEELEKETQLSSAISAYYEYIWKSSKIICSSVFLC